MSNTYQDNVVATFRTRLTESFELDDDSVTNICDIVRGVLETVELPIATKTRRIRNSSGKPRKKSGYNMFVKDKMQDEVVKSMSHREKMKAIGAMWKELSDEQKTPFNEMANEANQEQDDATETTEEA